MSRFFLTLDTFDILCLVYSYFNMKKLRINYQTYSKTEVKENRSVPLSQPHWSLR